MISIPVYDIDGKEVEKLKLDAKIFNGEVKKSVLHQALLMYQANKRRGAASSKKRGEVAGGGRKPWKQKGTGRARAGSIRSPIWKGGGVVFGPKPRDFSYQIPKKIKDAALRYSINDKINNNKLIILDKIKMKEPKTKIFSETMDNLKAGKNILLIIEKTDVNIMRSSRNLPFTSVKQAADSNAFDILTKKQLIVTKAGLKLLAERIKS